MKIGDHVYLITERHQTGAGIPCTISALHDSMVEVLVEFAQGPPIRKVYKLEDILSSNLFTQSILNLVYQTYEEIQHKYGSIVNLTAVTKPLTLKTTLIGTGPGPKGETRTGAEATGTLKRSDFDVKAFLPAVSDEVDLIIAVEAIKQ
jgi:hypothetical protein